MLEGVPVVVRGTECLLKRGAEGSLRVIKAHRADASVGQSEAVEVLHAEDILRVLSRVSETTIELVVLVTMVGMPFIGGLPPSTRVVNFRVSPDHIKDITEDLCRFAGLTLSASRHLLAVVNPMSGAKNALQTFQTVIKPVLEAAGITTALQVTNKPGHAEQFVRDLGATQKSEFASNVDGLIVLGGDGTVLEVQTGNYEGPRLPLAIVPVGTDNSLAYSLGIGSLEQAILAIVKGPVLRSDLMCVRELGDDDKPGTILGYPSCIAGAGFTADVIDQIAIHREGSIVPARFRTFVYGIRQFLCLGLNRHRFIVRYSPSTAAMTTCTVPDGRFCSVCENSPIEEQVTSQCKTIVPLKVYTGLSIGTIPAKNMSAGPDARLYPFSHFGDGALDIVSVGAVPEIEFFRRASCIVVRGLVDRGEQSSYVKAQSVVIEAENPPPLGYRFVLNIDGDPRYPKTNRVIIQLLRRAASLHAFRKIPCKGPTGRSIVARSCDTIMDALNWTLTLCTKGWMLARTCRYNQSGPILPL